jgi:hypothetical protein
MPGIPKSATAHLRAPQDPPQHLQELESLRVAAGPSARWRCFPIGRCPKNSNRRTYARCRTNRNACGTEIRLSAGAADDQRPSACFCDNLWP